MSERNNPLLRECYIFQSCPPLDALTVFCLFGSQNCSQHLRCDSRVPWPAGGAVLDAPFCPTVSGPTGDLCSTDFLHGTALQPLVPHFVPIVRITPSQAGSSALVLVKFNMVGDCLALIYPDMCPSVICRLIFSPSSIYHSSNGTESVQLQMTVAVCWGIFSAVFRSTQQPF